MHINHIRTLILFGVLIPYLFLIPGIVLSSLCQVLAMKAYVTWLAGFKNGIAPTRRLLLRRSRLSSTLYLLKIRNSCHVKSFISRFTRFLGKEISVSLQGSARPSCLVLIAQMRSPSREVHVCKGRHWASLSDRPVDLAGHVFLPKAAMLLKDSE